MQNDKRYWLRGLFIGLIISIIIILKIVLSPVYCIGMSVDGTGCTSPSGIDTVIYNVKILENYLMIAIVYFIIAPILLSTLMGYFYGKIKNRNKTIKILNN